MFVEDYYVRAAFGGTGEAKCIGNYGASLKAAERAAENGCDQVLWLDAKEHKYIEEVGSMNIFFVIDGVVVTPALSGSILPGITRKSCIELLRYMGYQVEERAVSIDELLQAQADGRLTEIFGSGTAAVISPVGSLLYKGTKYSIGDGKMGAMANLLYQMLTSIQYGQVEENFNWVYKLSTKQENQ